MINNSETVKLIRHNKDTYEVIVIHDQSGSSYGMKISIDSMVQLYNLIDKNINGRSKNN